MTLIDEIILDAMRKGKFADLPGQGRPLQLDDEAYVPSHLRMAHKLLRDNDLAPDWIMQGRELEAARAALLTSLGRAAGQYRQTKAAAPWHKALASARVDAERYNRQVTSYNLKLPRGVAHQAHLNVEREADRLLNTANM
jgi:hypothetical protein